MASPNTLDLNIYRAVCSEWHKPFRFRCMFVVRVRMRRLHRKLTALNRQSKPKALMKRVDRHTAFHSMIRSLGGTNWHRHSQLAKSTNSHRLMFTSMHDRWDNLVWNSINSRMKYEYILNVPNRNMHCCKIENRFGGDRRVNYFVQNVLKFPMLFFFNQGYVIAIALMQNGKSANFTN